MRCSTCIRLLWLAGFLAEHASELVELVFSTRPSYDDAESQRAVVDVLRTALQDEAFLKAFAGALVRYEGPWASAQVLDACACSIRRRRVLRIVPCQSLLMLTPHFKTRLLCSAS